MRTFSFAINYNGRNIIASGTIEQIEQEQRYYRNGDVGHPQSGGEIYIEKITDQFFNDITNQYSDLDFDLLTDIIASKIKE